jgi:hypothetical protein
VIRRNPCTPDSTPTLTNTSIVDAGTRYIGATVTTPDTEELTVRIPSPTPRSFVRLRATRSP